MQAISRILGGVLIAGALIQGCENPREDRRIVLCKDIAIVQLRLDKPVDWQGISTNTHGPNGALVSVRFRAGINTDGGGESRISCHYRYDAVDDTALGLADPMSSYSTSPNHVEIDGRVLSRSELAEAIKQAMIRQARGFLDQG